MKLYVTAAGSGVRGLIQDHPCGGFIVVPPFPRSILGRQDVVRHYVVATLAEAVEVVVNKSKEETT